MSIGSVLGNLGSTALNISLTVTPQGRALGAANELMGGGAKDMIGALVDTLMKGLFSEPNPLAGGSAKIKDWGKDNEGADNPLLKMLAQFMDASNGAYGKPHDASGSVGNWKDELSEDNILSKDELSAFKQGLTEVITSLINQSLGQAITGLGMGGGMGGMSPLGGGMGGGMGGMGSLGGGMGGGMGGMGSLGGGIGGGMGGMDPLGGGMGGTASLGGGIGGGMGGMDPFAGGLSGLGGSLLGGGLSGMGQTGMGFGLNMATQAGLKGVNSIETHQDPGNRHFVNEEDRGTAEEIGKFMDQHPEIYGKPEYQQKNSLGGPKTDTKSWAEALSKPDDDGMTGASMDKFKGAMNDIKGAAVGDTSGLPSGAARADALMTFSSIASQEMGSKLA